MFSAPQCRSLSEEIERKVGCRAHTNKLQGTSIAFSSEVWPSNFWEVSLQMMFSTLSSQYQLVSDALVCQGTPTTI